MELPFIARVVLVLCVLSKFVQSTTLDCTYACQSPFSRVQFNGSLPDDDYELAQCTNLLRVQSIFYCMKTHCSDYEIKTGLKEFANECELYGKVELLPWSVISNITDQDASSWIQINVEDLDGKTVYNNPLLLSEPLFEISLRTSAAWDQSVVTRATYGYAMYGFFAVVFFIAMVNRLIRVLIDLRQPTSSSSPKSKVSSWRAIKLATKRHITTPASFKHHVAEPVGWCTVPQRLQFLTICAFVIVNFVLSCVSYDLFEGNLYWADTKTQMWRYLADRTGVLAISNLPLMFAFAMRNNVLLWLTGWSFSTFNMFHRWVARVATVEAVVHSIAYSVEVYLDGGNAEFLESWTEQYWYMGGMATVVMSLLCCFSIYPIRKRWYEIFLMIHILFGVVFLVGIWYHVEIFEGEYNPFIWPCIAVWGFDRLIRIGRVFYLNKFSFTATTTYNSESDIIRITVPVRSGFKPQPGTHYYLYGLSGFKPWESHPFTLCTWEEKWKSASGTQTLSFIVRPFDSYTARLRNNIIKAKDQRVHHEEPTPTKFRMAIEGPYGSAHTLSRYNSILFIMGGSGISVALSHLQALHEAMSKNADLPIHSVRLVWAVRDAALFHDVHQHELAHWLSSSSPLSSKADFHVDVHVTRDAASTKEIKAQIIADDDSPVSSPTIADLKGMDMHVDTQPTKTPAQVISDKDFEHKVTTVIDETSSTSSRTSRFAISHQRPVAQDIVLDTATTMCTRGEKLAVVCCGPAGMADDTRAAVVAAYTKGYEEVDLISEVFGW